MAVKLQMNVPQTFELEFPEGLRVQSKFGGDQVMFTLTNGDKWYTDPFIASKIRDAKIGAYTPFTVTKREVVNGNRRVVEYEIERILDESLAAPPAAVADPRPTVRAAESANGATAAVFVGAGASVNRAPAAALGVGSAAGPVAVPSPSSVALMKIAAIGAIDVVLEAEAYARSRGMVDFAFDPGSIQDLVTSLFISMEKRGGRA